MSKKFSKYWLAASVGDFSKCLKWMLPLLFGQFIWLYSDDLVYHEEVLESLQVSCVMLSLL